MGSAPRSETGRERVPSRPSGARPAANDHEQLGSAAVGSPVGGYGPLGRCLYWERRAILRWPAESAGGPLRPSPGIGVNWASGVTGFARKTDAQLLASRKPTVAGSVGDGTGCRLHQQSPFCSGLPRFRALLRKRRNLLRILAFPVFFGVLRRSPVKPYECGALPIELRWQTAPLRGPVRRTS
jgi:hypothetical protein